MKKINRLFVKKRFYLFILLCLSPFLMNLFLWNEASQLIRNIPKLQVLKEKSTEDIYEIHYQPDANSAGAIKEYHSAEIKNLNAFFQESFFKPEEKKNSLYLSKSDYFNETIKNKDDLIPITKELFFSNIGQEVINISFIDDLFVTNISRAEATMLEASANKLNFPMKLVSLKDRFLEEYNYYFFNFIFGLSISAIFLSFSVLLIYLLISSSLKLFSQEIHLLRIVGLSKKKILTNFIYLFLIPIVISFAVFFAFVSSTGISFIFFDYLYLLLINLLFLTLSLLVLKKKIGGVLNS